MSADWDVAIVNGQPEMVLNREMVEALIASSPLGPDEARRRLVAAGYPFAACAICGTPLGADVGRTYGATVRAELKTLDYGGTP